MTDKELLEDCVMLSKTEYNGSIRALQIIDIISDVLDAKMYQGDTIKTIKLVLGKNVKDDEEE